jgi:hypothetical protein
LEEEMWQEILDDFDRRHCCNEQSEIGWFRDQPSLHHAIDRAARAIDARGRRYSHQYRIRRQSIAHACAALLAAEAQIARAASFDDLLNVITSQLHEVPGVGRLYRYDAAFRIGAHLGLFPTRVYLHAGTRVGARALSLAYEKEALEMDEVPPELRHRAPHEVEDIFCIYSDVFRGNTIVGERCLPLKETRRQVRC